MMRWNFLRAIHTLRPLISKRQARTKHRFHQALEYLEERGLIDASGNDLGSVSVQGDLGRLVAGDSVPTTTALASLTVQSLGRMGLDTQQPGGTLQTVIVGNVGPINIKGDMKDAQIAVQNG